MGRKKKIQEAEQEIEKQVPKYTCKWCGIEKSESKFFKCCVNRGVLICSDCIKKKYNEICAQREKLVAIVVCCHYLDIAFYKYIYDSLGDKQGIGYYVRQLNLYQNEPDDFAKGLLHNNILSYVQVDKRIDNAKNQLNRVIKDLEGIRNDI